MFIVFIELEDLETNNVVDLNDCTEQAEDWEASELLINDRT